LLNAENHEELGDKRSDIKKNFINFILLIVILLTKHTNKIMPCAKKNICIKNYGI